MKLKGVKKLAPFFCANVILYILFFVTLSLRKHKQTTMKTITAVRKAFWETHPEFKSEYRKTWRQNKYRTDIRCAFVDFTDSLCKEGQITEALANRATL